MTKTIRLLIADDHLVVRKGLRILLTNEPDINIVGEAENGVDVVEKARTLKPDVILLDMVMPEQTGLQAIPQILQHSSETRILVLTSFAEDDKVFPSIKSGALGYLLKDSSSDQLIEAIHSVHRGELSLHPSIATRLIKELNQPSNLPPTGEPLTEREVDVLKLVARGLSNQEIAAELVVSERTVGNHIGNILSKLHLANRTQAALYALREGLAKLE